MKLKYSFIITFLLIWGTVLLMRVTAERDDLLERIATLEGMQNETFELQVDQNAELYTPTELPNVSLANTAQRITMSASEWADKIKEIAPANISLKAVEATDAYVNLVGEAKSNSDVAGLMRAIEQADLGTPDLKQVMRNGDTSEFILGVKTR